MGKRPVAAQKLEPNLLLRRERVISPGDLPLLPKCLRLGFPRRSHINLKYTLRERLATVYLSVIRAEHIKTLSPNNCAFPLFVTLLPPKPSTGGSRPLLLISLLQGIGYAPLCMELTLEVYRNIVKYAGNRDDIASLCRVSKGFRFAAERSLYNTLFMRNDQQTISLCKTLANSPRLAVHVEALTISLADDVDVSDEDEDDSDEEFSYERPPPLEMDWPSLAGALGKTTSLRYLNVHINNGTSTAVSWVLSKTSFQLRQFHCDFDWDHDLVHFLDSQTKLEDLYIRDYQDDAMSPHPTIGEPSTPPLRLHGSSISTLSTLECTFSEAAMALVPGRPVTHLKTCFSQTEKDAKRKEMSELLSKIVQSTRTFRSLDIADSSYTDQFSMELLTAIANKGSMISELRHLGTFVLPINGKERLRFYGLLRRFSNLHSVELEISDWEPPPSSPMAIRALASELRLYIPSVKKIIFVEDFDRSVVTAIDGICRVDFDISTDLLWREN